MSEKVEEEQDYDMFQPYQFQCENLHFKTGQTSSNLFKFDKR